MISDKNIKAIEQCTQKELISLIHQMLDYHHRAAVRAELKTNGIDAALRMAGFTP